MKRQKVTSIQGVYKATSPSQSQKNNKAHHPLVGRQPFQKPYKGHTLLTNIQSSPAPQTTNKRIVKLLDI